MQTPDFIVHFFIKQISEKNKLLLRTTLIEVLVC